jgi:hypothetical protein
MPVRPWLVALMILALSGLPTHIFAACKIGRLAELPVTMRGLRPLVSARINGAEAQFIADSGAFYSLITPAAAAQFKLRLGPAPYWFVMTGVGGEARAWLTTVKTFNSHVHARVHERCRRLAGCRIHLVAARCARPGCRIGSLALATT